MKQSLLFLISIGCCVVLMLSGCITNQTKDEPDNTARTIIDMRNQEVELPTTINRVIDISDGFVGSVMYSLGVVDALVGLGSTNLKEIDTYEFQDASGENYTYTNGTNPLTILYEPLMDLPAVAEYGVAVNYETIASLNPDVVIIRIGFCSMNTDEYGTDNDITNTIDTIESLDIPVVVLYGPPALSTPNMDRITEEITIIGSVFNKTAEALSLATYLESTVDLVINRTQSIAEEDKPEVLLFGLSPNARQTGGAGDVLCTDTMESYFIETIVNAKNAYTETGGWKILSAEQLLSLNPDVIVLPTDWGYHPPRELYNASYYENLQELDAVKNRRVWALPYTPYNCAKRMEYPIEIMIIAKAAYPDLFEDIKINEWVLEFYQNVYHVDEETAKNIRSAQLLNWTVEDDV